MRWQRAWAAWWDLAAERATSRSVEGPARADGLRRALEAYELEDRTLLSATPLPADLLAADLPADGGGDSSAATDGSAAAAEAADAATESTTATLDDAGPNGDAAAAGDFDASAPLDPAAEDAPADGPAVELVFVQDSIRDLDQLLAGLIDQLDAERTLEVVVLDSSADGLDQVSQALAARRDVAAVHFVTHGADGMARLGGSWLDAATLDARFEQIERWAEALTDDADLVFYGCDLVAGEAGQDLVERLSALTGADVAASTDATGQAALGGDWDFEYRVGDVDTGLAFSTLVTSEWQGRLATYVVTNTNNSGAGSLRQAIIDANNNAGADIISFNISGTGTHTIGLSTALPTITGTVTIDATTDDSFAANGNRPAIVLDGGYNFTGDGFVLTSTADGSVIRGFVIRKFSGDGIEIQAGSDNNVVAGNYIGRMTTSGTDLGSGNENTGAGIRVEGANNTIGGTTAANRNVVSGNSSYGILITGAAATGNVVSGNYVGLTAAGTATLGNSNDGVRVEVSANNNTIGGSTTAHRNVISGNSDGVQLALTSGTVVRNNYIGTDWTGTVDLGNTDDGIDLDSGASNNQLLNNLISGNSSDGIDLGDSGTSSNNVIQGNLIGTQADGTSSLGNSAHGILVGNGGTVTGATIGGVNAGEGNTIAYNAGDGIYVSSGSGITIRGNSSFGNTGLAIDLGTNGVTANDTGDGDTGANALQNHPRVTYAYTSGTHLVLSGSLNSTASGTFTIDFYSNASADPTGYGEGSTYLGSTTVTTNGSGDATFSNVVLSAAVTAGSYITATATNNATSNTSEFSLDRIAVTNSLWLSTTADVTGSGVPGLDAWGQGEVVAFGPPNFQLDPVSGTTSGTLESVFNLANFASGVDIDALEYVTRTITIGSGGNTLTLQAGDVLISTDAGATLTSVNSLTVSDDEVFLFRPTVAGVYTSGTFTLVLDNFGSIHGGGDTWSLALVEQSTTVGDVTLAAGTFLFSRDGGAEDNDIYRFVPTGVGAGTTSGSVAVLVEGDQVGIGAKIYGLELVENAITIGGTTVNAGRILVTLDAADTVGSNNVSVAANDVFALSFSTTTLGSGTAAATASLLLDGSDVNLSSASENVDGLALFRVTNTAPTLNAAQSPALTAQNEDSGAPSGAVGTLVSALVDFSSPAGQVDNVTDPDAGALLGIAITAADTSNGTWHYSTDGGANWNALGAVSSASARLLAADANTRVYFQPNANYNGTLSSGLTFRAWDRSSGTAGGTADASTNGGITPFSTATDTASLTINAVNDAPVHSVPGAQSVSEDGALVFSAAGGNLISISDVDAGSNSVQATLTVTNGTLNLAGTTGLTFSTGDGNADATMTFTGSQTDVNAALASLSYSPTQNYTGAATLTVTTSDLGNSGSGGAQSDTDNVAITVNAVNDTPLVTTTGSTLAYTENNAATPVDPGLVVSDVEGTLTGATVTISSNYASGQDVLAFTNQLGITGSWDSGTGTLTLTGTTTVANYQTALRSVTYQNTSDAPSTATRVVTFVVNDGTVNSKAGAQSTLLSTGFSGGTAGFTYVDDPFGTSDPTKADGNHAASGGFTDGALRVYLGPGPNTAAVSGGWSTTFTVANAGEVIVSVRYRMTMGEGFETDEYGEVVLAVDGTRYGPDTNSSLLHVDGNDNGGGSENSGWRQATVRMNLTAGNHTLTLGAYNNKATASDEWVEAFFDDVTVSEASNVRPISVTSVNDAPVLDNAGTMTLTAITEDQTASAGDTVAAILASAGGDRVTDVDSGAVEGIAVTALTSGNGVWEYSTDGGSNWNAVGTVANNSALLLRASDRLRFVPDGLNADAASVSFRAWDQTSGTAGAKVDASTTGGTTAFSTATETASISVTAINDAPVLDNAGAMTLTNVSENNTSSATVATVIASAGGDRITDSDTGAVEGIAITAINSGNGTWRYSTDGGSNWSDVGAVSNTSALLLRSTDLIAYAGNGQNGGTADFTFRAWDQTSGAAGAKVDASTNGGTTAFSTATETASITTTSVNDAPVLDNAGTMTLTAITEDQTTNAGDTVAAILASAGGDRVTDVDSGAVEGIAVTALTSGNGVWEYSTDGGSNWNAVGTVANNSALLLRASDRLRFVPDGLNADAASVSFRAWDQTSGAAGAKVDASTAGGTTAFSTATETAGISVTAVNDAPTLNAAQSPVLTAQNEDSGAPSGAVGTLVSALVDFASPAGQVDNVTDPDSGALLGIAITAADTTNGVWFYSTDGGSNWNALGAVSDASARLLTADASTRVYFQPNANYNGTISNAITFRAWDQTSGANGATADTTTNGGITAFSTATDTASLTISAVNDAPVLDNAGTMTLTAITEDQTTNAGDTVAAILASAGGDRVTDVDSGAVEGIALTATASGNGTWEYSTDGGSNWNAVGAVANNSALLLRASDRLRFVPDGLNADAASVTFRAWDQTSGAAGAKVDASTTGGTTAFSTATETAGINVTAVNDAPVNTAPGSRTVLTNGTLTFSTAAGGPISVSDVDAGTLEVSLTVGQGTLTLNGTTGLTFSAGDGTADATMTFTGSVAQVNAALNGLVYNPSNGYVGTDTLQITTSDLGATGAGGTLTDADNVLLNVVPSNRASLWLGTDNAATAIGGVTWGDSEIVSFGDPNLSLEPGTTAGTFSSIVNLESLAADGNANLSAIHWVSRSVTVGTGGNSVTLQRGDLLFSVDANETFGGVAVTEQDLVLFRPNSPTDYSGGTFSILINSPTGDKIREVSLVEQTVVVGGVTLQAGDLLLVQSGATYDKDVWRFQATSAGNGTTSGTLTELIDGSDIGIGAHLGGLALVQATTQLGNVTLQAGQLLLSTRSDDNSVGTNNLAVTSEDVFVLSVTQAGSTTSATAALLFQGADVGLSANGEELFGLTLVATNYAPDLSGANDFPALNEDPATNGGTLVSALLSGHVSDVDAGALTGLAVTAVDNANGVWQYSTNGGGVWNNFGSPSQASARLLAADANTLVRFVPNAHWNGSTSLTFQAWDQTTGTAGGTADASVSGGVTAFSTASATSALTVNAVNDAPTATITPASYTVNEQTTLTLHGTGLSIADVDAGGAAVQATVSVVSGTLTAAAGTTGVSVSGSGTSSLTLSGTLTQINNLLAGASGGTLTYTLNSDTPPASDTLTLQASDLGNSGSGGTLTGSDTATINLTAVNDAPMNNVPGVQTTAVSTPLVFNAAGGNLISTSDADVGGSSLQITLTATNGLVTLGSLAGLSFTTGDGTADAVMTFTGTLANVNAALDGLSFNPTAGYSGAASLEIVTSDQGNTGTGGALTATDTIGIQVGAYTFRQGDNGYTGTEDTELDSGSPNTAKGGNTSVVVDLNDGSGQAQGLIQFANLFGSGPGQIPIGATINSATLTVYVTDIVSPSDHVYLHRMLTAWSEASTWNSLTGGIQTNDVEAMSTADADMGMGNVGFRSFTVTAAVQAWADGATNHGWAILSDTTDGWAFNSSEHGTVSQRPYLTVSFTPPQPPAIDLDLNNSSGASGANYNATWTEDGGARLIADADAVITDADDTQLVSMTVTITNLQDGALESLTANTAGTGITAAYDSGTGVLSLTGTDTVANYQQVLRTVAYNNTSQNPNSTARTITVVAYDGLLNSSTATTTLAMTAVNDAPVNAVPGAQSVTEDGSLTFSSGGGNAISVSDIDLAGGSLQVTLTGTGGVVTLSGTSGLSFSVGDGAADATMTFSGSAANINAALNGLVFTTSPDFTGAGSLQIVTSDLGNTGTGGPQTDSDTVNITVNAVNDAPTATITPASYSVNEQTTLTLHGTGLSIADVDAGGATVQATVSVVSGTLTAAAGTTGVSVSGSGTSSVTLSGTLTQINNLLAGASGGTLTYALNSDTPPASDTLTLQASDLGNSGSGGTLTGSDTATINLTAVNDAPVHTVPGPQVTAEDTPLVFNAAGGNLISIGDVDAGGAAVQVTLSATGGTLTLSGTTGLTFSTGDGTGDASMQFSGTLVDVNAALNGLTFNPTPDFTGGAGIGIVTSDLGSTGTGGPQTDTDAISINVTAVNDPPTLGFPGPDLNYTENDGPSELDTTATVADIDSPDFATGTLTIAFTVSGQAEDRLAVRHQGTGPGQVGVSGGNVTYGGVTVGSWSGGTSGATPLVVTFNANATAAVVQAVARAVTYENVSDTPSTLTRTWQATLTDGDGGTSTPVTGNIFLTAVNDVPVITSNGGGPTANVNVAENSTAVTTVTATDLDLPTQTLAYSISGGADAGRFTIDSGTGALSFSTAPDREAATDANGDHVYEVTVQVSDGAGGTDTQTLFVTVTDVDEFNVGPVSDANAAADLVPENAANGTLVGLTAQATDADATTSAITYSLDDSAGGRFTIDSATGVVTVANGGLLDYEAATSHDITVRATSADGSSSTRTFTIALGPVNDNAPVITSNGGGGSASVTVAENTTAVTTVAATDADLPAQTVSYSISGGADAGRFTIDSATGALTFSAPPDFENPLDADGDNVYEVTVQASDGAGGADTQNLSVSVSNTNEAPVATIGPATYAVDEQVTLTLHGTGLALADVDAGANPIQATVSVVSGTLTAAAGTTGVTVLGSGTSSVTLSGTVAQINDLLAGNLGGTLTYVLSSDTPPAGDTLTLQVNDQGHSGAGGPLTASDTATINITALNDAPVNSVPGSQNMTEDGTLVFSSAGGNLISVADVDVGAGTVQLTLRVTSGTLTLSGTTGLAFSAGDGSADAGMQFTGTLVDVNAALAGLTYAPLANFAGADQLTITVDDLGSTGSRGPQTDTDTVAIAVTAVNDAPTLSAPATVNTAFQAPVTFAASLGRAILPGDVDAAAAAVEVRLTATSGVLSLGQPGAVTIVSGSASGGSAVVFRGTVSDVAQALEGLVYTPDATFRGAAQLQVDVDDLGNSGSGGPLTAAATVVIDVAPAAQRLTLVAPAQVSTTNFAALFSNASGFSLVVVDAYGEDALVTLSLTASAGQIVLSQSTGLVFLAGSGAPSAQVVVEGSLSAVNAALDGAQFLLGANLGTLDVSVVDTPRDPGPAHSAASQVTILQSLAPAPPPPPTDDPITDTDSDDAEDSDDTLPDAVPLQGLLDQRDGPTTVFEFSDRSGPARSEGPATHADVAAPRRLLAFANETLADGALTGVEWQPDLGEVLLLARGPLSTTAIAALDATGAIPWELLVSDVERGVAALGFDDWETGVVSVTAAASLGYVLWTVRAGTLLTSLFYAMPAWRSFDVLPVIDSFDKQPVRRQGSGPEHDLDLAGLVDRNLSLPAKN